MANGFGARLLSMHGEWETTQQLIEELCAVYNYREIITNLPGNNGQTLGMLMAQPVSRPVLVFPPKDRAAEATWFKAAYEAAQLGQTVHLLVPARIDTKRWHQYVLPALDGKIRASEIHMIRGRLTYEGFDSHAPFAHALVVYKAKPVGRGV